MNKSISSLLLAGLLGGTSPAWPAVRVINASEQPAAARVADAAPPMEPKWQLAVGPSFFVVNEGRSHNTAAAALRYSFKPRPWSLELGSLLPVNSRTLRSESRTVGAASYDIQASLSYAVHGALVLELPHGRQDAFIPEASLGASLASIKNVNRGTTYSSSYHGAWSPFIRLGLQLFPQNRVSFRLEAAYVRYANSPEYDNQSFDLPLSGWILHPVLQWKF